MKKIAIALFTLSLCLPASGVTTQQKSINNTSIEQNESDPEFQFNMGRKYLGERKFELSELWFLKAAKQNHLEAQEFLAHQYLLGENGKVDYPSASYWFFKASENGSAVADFTLGAMFIEGEYHSKDIDFGLYMMNKAKAKGFKPAIDYLEVFEKAKKSCEKGNKKDCDFVKKPPLL